MRPGFCLVRAGCGRASVRSQGAQGEYSANRHAKFLAARGEQYLPAAIVVICRLDYDLASRLLAIAKNITAPHAGNPGAGHGSAVENTLVK